MRFPWYVRDEDKILMTTVVPTELAQWRASVTYHKSLPTVNSKLKNRKYLGQTFALLRMAWRSVNVSETMEAEAVAA
jgi:hypothetical protein